MPLEIKVTMDSGDERMVYVPTDLTVLPKSGSFEYTETWPWTDREKEVVIPIPVGNIVKVEIDPDGWMADINPDNNVWPKEEKAKDED